MDSVLYGQPRLSQPWRGGRLHRRPALPLMHKAHMASERARLRGPVRALAASVSASAAALVHRQPVAADAAAPSRAETAELAAKGSGRALSLLPRASAVHHADVSLKAGVLGRGVLALVAKEAVARAPVRGLPVSLHTSLPSGGKVALFASK